jgi:hypothetical protein
MPRYSLPKRIERPVPGVAVDLDECPADKRWGTRICRCGRCAICGHPKHCSLHGGVYGEPKGGQPYDHEFKAANV